MRTDHDGEILARAETLSALPGLLTLARQVIVTTFESGDPEIEGLKTMLDECVVGLHRLRLRERLRAGDALSGA